MNYRPIYAEPWVLARPKVKYHGAFPSGFLERARVPLGIHIDDPLLHVCGGRVRDYPFRGLGGNDKTVDLDVRLNPDFLLDVRFDLPWCPGGDLWPSLLADPPYTELDAAKYACGAESFPAPNPLLKLCLERVRPGGRVGFLHYKWPDPPSVLIGSAKTRRRVPMVDGCRIKEIFVNLVTCGRNSNARHYVVFEKLKP